MAGMSAEQPFISLQNVRKVYRSKGTEFLAVSDVTMDVKEGELVALVGPSGCGKSTLLRSLAGLETISGGDMRIAGQLMNNVPPRKRDVAMVFQSYALYPHMTVEQNLAYSLRIRGVKKADARKAAEALGLSRSAFYRRLQQYGL